MANDTYNYRPIALKLIRTAGRIGNVEPFADRVAIRPQLPGKRVVDDDYMLVRGVISFGKIASAKQSRSDGVEVSRQDGAMIGIGRAPQFGRCALLVVVVIPICHVIERNV